MPPCDSVQCRSSSLRSLPPLLPLSRRRVGPGSHDNCDHVTCVCCLLVAAAGARASLATRLTHFHEISLCFAAPMPAAGASACSPAPVWTMPANAAGKLVFALACAASALAAVAAAGADGPPCPGLMIGTQPLGSDIMRNGLVMAQWAFGRPGQDSHVVGDEVCALLRALPDCAGPDRCGGRWR